MGQHNVYLAFGIAGNTGLGNVSEVLLKVVTCLVLAIQHGDGELARVVVATNEHLAAVSHIHKVELAAARVHLPIFLQLTAVEAHLHLHRLPLAADDVDARQQLLVGRGLDGEGHLVALGAMIFRQHQRLALRLQGGLVATVAIHLHVVTLPLGHQQVDTRGVKVAAIAAQVVVLGQAYTTQLLLLHIVTHQLSLLLRAAGHLHKHRLLTVAANKLRLEGLGEALALLVAFHLAHLGVHASCQHQGQQAQCHSLYFHYILLLYYK